MVKKTILKCKMVYRIISSIIKLIRNPYDVSPIFKISEFRNHMSFQLCMAQAHNDEQLSQLIRENYRSPKPHDLEQLGHLPAGSLGQVFAQHMKHHQMDVVFYPAIDDTTTDDLTYLRLRARETHDIHHAVLGMKPDLLGEMSISAFYLSQLNIPLSSALIGIGFLVAVIKKPFMIEHLMDALIKGWTMGKNAQANILSMKWEEMWERPIADIRSELGISVAIETFEQVHQREIEKRERTKALGLIHSRQINYARH